MEAVVEVAVEVPPQEVQLLDLQQQAQVPVTQLLDQQQLAQVLVEPQEPSEFDAECTPGVEGGGRSWGRAGRGCSRCQADNRPNLEDSRVLEELLQVSTGARLLNVDKRRSDRSRGRCCSAKHRRGVT